MDIPLGVPMRRIPFALAAGVLAMAQPVPPVATLKPHVNTWHGKAYPDPYFWLREKENPEVLAHLKAENAYTEALTKDLKPFSEALYNEMLGRIKQTDMAVPYRKAGYIYYSRTEEGKQYGILCRKKGDEKEPEEVYLDLNALAKGLKFFSLGGAAMSPDQRRFAYITDTTGFRQYRLQIKDLQTGQLLPDTAERVTSLAWANDNQTLFYTTEDAVTKRSDTLWRLKLGGQPEQLLVEKDESFGVGIAKSLDDRILALGFNSTDTWENRILEADRPEGSFRPTLGRTKGHKYTLDHRDGTLFITTNQDAKNYRVVTAPVSDPKTWKPFIAHDPKVLVEGISVFKGFAVAQEKVQGQDRIRIYDFAKRSWHTVTFPEALYTAGLSANAEFDTPTVRLSYQSMVTPGSVYDYDMTSRKRTLLKQQEVLGGYDPSRYETKRLWIKARDGVQVPLSVVHRKGLKLDGTNPLWLYGYGSYGYGQSPTFSSSRLSLLDRGVVWVTAHIRGGNELGEGWHDDGMLMKKKHTFHDFIDAADFLVKQKWTSRKALVIEGGSAGGLLVGAVVNLRPDLFRAAHAAVPFVDVMNTMMDNTLPLTTGEYLEWGNPNEKPAFDYMLSYSPYDNLKKAAYPAMLVTTGLNDSQVMYWEPAKYVAKLRTLKTDSNPLLLKVDLGAGHGGASGRYDALKDKAFEYAWMLGQLGITK